MRFIRNFLLTIICIAAIGAGVIFGYYQYRGHKEKELLSNGISLMEQGNYRLAREKFAEAQQYENKITRYLSEDALEEDLYKYTAICDFRLGDIDAAASIYDRLLRIHPRDPSLMEYRATCYAAQGDMEKAVEMFDTAISMDRKDYTRIYNAALTLREYGNTETGRKYFEELLADHGDEIDDLTRGKALCFLGQYEEAARILDGIEIQDPQVSGTGPIREHENALSLLESCEEDISSSPDMLNLKGTALCGLERYEEALDCFEQALPLSQEGTALHKSILFNRIAAVENLRDFARAKELAAEYMEKYPDDERMQRENKFLESR